MSIKERCDLVSDMAFAEGVLKGLSAIQPYPNATNAVADALERLDRAIKTVSKLPIA